MDKNKIKTKLEKEKREMETLKEKRLKLEKLIKEKSHEIIMYENQIMQFELKEIEKDLSRKGMSFNDLKHAISHGDFSEIQEKIQSYL